MNTTTTSLNNQELGLGGPDPQRLGRLWGQRSWWDWGFALLLLAAGLATFFKYLNAMDGYEQGILLAAIPTCIALAWFWRPLSYLMVAVGVASLGALALYQTGLPAAEATGQASLARAETVFWLKYFLSSQSAILWMCVLFFMATVFYWIALLSEKHGQDFGRIASRITWAAVTMALIGTMVRWYEGYLMGPDVGHIPVSNLYEVFVLFCWLTALFYLYYEAQHNTYAMGAFALLIISAAVGFLLWYTLVRDAHQIQPLVPALQSWWMKLHVPANFIGYGTFALAAMVAFAYLIKQHASDNKWYQLLPLWLLGVVLCFEPIVFRGKLMEKTSSYWLVYFGLSALLVAGILTQRKRIAQRLPSFAVLDDVMYKSIAVGFAFFTIATVLGAFWAADAWGGYWSWDPKETWALIVWLNYAAWLHLRLMKGLRGTMAAWWALTGLAITTFAFLGVNMFLSGLHSYGTL